MFIPFYSGVNFYLPWPCSEFVIRTESARIFYSVHKTEVAQKVKKQRTIIIDRPRLIELDNPRNLQELLLKWKVVLSEHFQGPASMYRKLICARKWSFIFVLALSVHKVPVYE